METKYNYSIIIPHFNIPDLLVRCLKSIPERDDIQVIVVDDQSQGSETYLDTIPELHRKNVEFYIVDEKKFAGHARNIGLDHAKGKWLMFADPDDFYVDSFMDIVDKYLNDSSDVIYFNIKSCDCYNTDHIIQDPRLSRFVRYEKTKDSMYFRLSFSEPWAKMVRKDFVVREGIRFQATRAHNDLLFGVKVAVLAKTFRIINEPIYWYVHREGSTGRSKGNESYEKLCDRINAWDAVQKFLNAQGYKTKIYLPVKPCIKVFKRDFKTYCRLIGYMKSQNMNYLRSIWLTIRFAISIAFGGHGPGFAEEVIK